MKTFTLSNLSPEEITKLTIRPAINYDDVFQTTQKIVDDVSERGDKALQEYTKKFDKADLQDFKVTKQEIENARNKLPENIKKAIKTAQKNIEVFHQSQIKSEKPVETMPGITCFRQTRPIEKVGLYIPGGTAVLFSTLLMLATPAKVAKCEEIILCTPPNAKGEVTPELLYAAYVCGVDQIFKVGGAQSIAGMAYGAESIPKVYKIFGPGNQYVTAAKMIVANSDANVGIDMPAGPSEVLVIADSTANPAYVAADLLSQAEHGEDSQVVLVTTSSDLADQVTEEVEKQLAKLPRNEITKATLKGSLVLIADSIEQCFEFSNLFAPEHLILNFDNYQDYIPMIKNAGSVFLGSNTPESVGDYASGTNHVLPTNGFARIRGGVSTDDFMKKITFQELTKEGLQNIGETVELMAKAEELDAHANAVSVRLRG